MNGYYRPGGFQLLPPVVKNLLIINGLFFLARIVFLERFKTDLADILGLFYPQSQQFRPYQIITHLFMHGSFGHIFSNMLALWMFGSVMENVWGSKRFLMYYLSTGIGAAFIHTLVLYYRYTQITADMDPAMIREVIREGYQYLQTNQNYVDVRMAELNNLLSTATVGASGAVFGLLLAFGMSFPNSYVYLYFAIPIKAKYFVALYGLLELYSGVSNNPSDNVAHFAHLGGMLFGYLMIRSWQKKRFY